MDINNYFLLFPVLLPIIAGVLLMFIKFGKREYMQLYILLILVIDLASIGWIALQPEDTLTLSSVLHCGRTACIFPCGYAFKDFFSAYRICMADGRHCVF